jgi:integrase
MATFTQRKSGWWQAKIRRKGYPDQSRSFKTLSDAEEWARSEESEIDKGVYVDRREADKNTLRTILEKYRDEVTPTHKGGNIEKIRINALLTTDLARYKMSSLSAMAISSWIAERLEKVSSGTVRREINVLSQVISKAQKSWGIRLAENPVALLEKPKEGRARDRRLEEGEEARLLQALTDHESPGEKKYRQGTRNPWILPIVIVAIETAMRRGELLGLRWANVNLSRQTVFLPDTKNGESRTVPLSKKAVATLEAMPRSIDGLVFPISPNALKKAFTRACVTAELGDFHFHDLRHEATSRLADKLPNVIELAAVTGHKDLRMLKRYYHPRAENLAKKLG